MPETYLRVLKLPGTNTLIIRQVGDRKFFTSSDNVIVMDVPNLAFVLKMLIISGNMDIKVLEGLLAELKE